MLDVADDPDNLPWVLLVYRIRVEAQENLLPNRVLVREEAARKCFVYHNRPRCGLRIASIKIASPFQGNPKCAEKAWTNFVVAGARPLVRLCFRVSKNREGVDLGELRRKTCDGTNGFDSR